MYPLDVTHVVLRRWRAGVRGKIRSFFLLFFLWKKAYMPIDANHISNSKDHILKPWQATSFEPWQAMVVRHCGSGTGCMAVQ